MRVRTQTARRRVLAALLSTAAAASAAPPRAGAATPPPAAMVESLSAPSAGVAALDYLATGRAVALPAGATLVLDYLGACIQETITAGAAGSDVQIGADQSSVTHGRVLRRRMDCDGGDLQLTAGQADTGGVAVYRGIGPAEPSLTLRGTMPVIVAPARAPVRIQRLDETAPAQDIAPPADAASGGRTLIDLARSGTALAPGGVYRISQGQRATVVRVDPAARPGALPLVLRLVPL